MEIEHLSDIVLAKRAIQLWINWIQTGHPSIERNFIIDLGGKVNTLTSEQRSLVKRLRKVQISNQVAE